MDNTQNITVLSLCAGYGGLEIGLAGALQRLLRVVAVEVEAYALANLVCKAEEGKLGIEALWPDLRTFPAERFRECFDIITAGYPCQPFSVAGKRQGTDDPRHLWPHIARIIEAVRPVWFFGENVSGHLTLGFPAVYRSLRNMGYTVEARLFSAAECYAPHRRERLFILAFNQNIRYARFRTSIYNQNGLCKSENGRSKVKRCSRKLADTTSQRIQRPESERAAQAGRQIDQQGDTTKLGNAPSKRLCRGEKNGHRQQSEVLGQRLEDVARWPARPGQPQYEWEEPRTVDNALFRRHQQKKEQIQTRRNSPINTNKRQAKSRLGRAASRTNCRVDRLRLLGNGVVPQQAEKAFRELMKLFEANR